MTTVVCDLDGVVYLGRSEIPGAGKALQRLDDAGVRVLFATNNSMRPPGEVARRIVEITGYSATPDQILTSAMAAASMLAGTGAVCLVVGGQGIGAALADVGLQVVDDWQVATAVVVGVDKDFGYEALDHASRSLRAGARFIATNIDPTYPTDRGLLPGAGAVVAALATASGITPEIAGKPHPPMRRLIASMVDDPVWVIGDRVDTDIALAGDDWGAILVATGISEGEAPPGVISKANLSGAVDFVLAQRDNAQDGPIT